jgi:hypothetical protein
MPDFFIPQLGGGLSAARIEATSLILHICADDERSIIANEGCQVQGDIQ